MTADLRAAIQAALPTLTEDQARPAAACEDREWDALLDAVDAAREDFPDHFQQWEREMSA